MQVFFFLKIRYNLIYTRAEIHTDMFGGPASLAPVVFSCLKQLLPPSHLSATLCFWEIHANSWKLGEPLVFNPSWIWSGPHLLCLECFFIYRALSDFQFWLSWHLYELTCVVIPLCRWGNWDSGWVWQVRWLAPGLRGSGRAGIRTQGSNDPGCPSPSHLGIAFCFYYLVHQYVDFVIPHGPV